MRFARSVLPGDLHQPPKREDNQAEVRGNWHISKPVYVVSKPIHRMSKAGGGDGADECALSKVADTVSKASVRLSKASDTLSKPTCSLSKAFGAVSTPGLSLAKGAVGLPKTGVSLIGNPTPMSEAVHRCGDDPLLPDKFRQSELPCRERGAFLGESARFFQNVVVAAGLRHGFLSADAHGRSAAIRLE